MEKVSLIITVKNEAKTLNALLHSIEAQSQQPDEVVIVDGGSSDGTYALLDAWKAPFRKVVTQKKGNRSIGRNLAIKLARNEWIAITDAGCVLDKDWLREITEPLHQYEVVAGYYDSLASNVFERAAACYMLVMPKNVNPDDFLPATRSMALTKTAWGRAGTFPQQFGFNEDYVFAHMLRDVGARMTFTQKAVVHWQPPTTWTQFYRQIYRFAWGDAAAGIFRVKVTTIYLRYLLFIFLLLKLPILFPFVAALYMGWSIMKNHEYVHGVQALWILPMMQVVSDNAVMAGNSGGMNDRIRHGNA